MPRVETIVNPEVQPLPVPPPVASLLIQLRPQEVNVGPEHASARPGPLPEDEEKQIESLAQSMRDIGQVMPIAVEDRSGFYWLLDGGRRVAAARLIDTDEQPFKLSAVVRSESSNGDYLRTAIHANLKRRGYTPLQLARLITDIKRAHGWTGSEEVANYLGVSRAQITQHEKILVRPEGMDETTYQDLLGKIGAGYMGAEAAFFTLTKVEPAMVTKVLEEAEKIAVEEPVKKSKKAKAKAKVKSASGKSATAKAAAAIPEPKWMKDQRAKSKAKREAAAAAGKTKVTTAQVRKAAEKTGAIKTGTVRTLADFKRVAAQLEHSSYPDPMRSFISFWFGEWQRGEVPDSELITRWKSIALLVGESVERQDKKTGKKK